jgi:hypothetical protein
VQQQGEFAKPIPGSRINDYRNSRQRNVRLYGLGDLGARVVGEIGRKGLPNVAVTSSRAPIGWQQVAGDAPADTNMIVIVCGEGDTALFDADDDKPDSLVTFVLLQSTRNILAVGDRKLSMARARSDLFVTTSDTEYVSDLIENLAS